VSTTVACPDRAATQALAARVAGILRPGDLVLLEGDLGAGKTTFVQGLARALGVDSAVTSPTFVLVNSHPTQAGFDLVHVDVYRLDRLSEVADLALAEMLEDGAVVVVEWGDRAAAALPGGHLLVRIETAGEDSRLVTLEAHGPAWVNRVAEVAA
jgi:tRNA threonylcarbamoyladenosine biosynthesis protein TsaE